MKCVLLLTILYGVLGGPVQDEAVQEFVTGNHKFSASVYKEILKEETGNFIVSPLSAEIVLALTNEAARGETAVELTKGLSLPNTKEKTQKAIKSLLPNLKKNDDRLKLLSANKIYTDKSLKLEDDFKTTAATVYDSGVQSVDFSNKAEASATVNNWVEDNTNHKIKNLIAPEDIVDDTKAILVNALYFSGKWVSPFEDYNTKNKKFFKTKDDSVDVATMSQTEYFRYYESPTLNAKFLELPYYEDDRSMVIVLPNEKDGLQSLEQNIEQVFAPQPLVNARVEVELPKFTTATTTKFVSILKTLGIRQLFEDADLTGLSSNIKNLTVSDMIQNAFINVTESGTEACAVTDADLTGLSSNIKNLTVSDVIQKAFINVTESGTEAAAATAVSAIIPFSGQFHMDPVYFHADHPFLYFIKSEGLIHYSGRLVNP